MRNPFSRLRELPAPRFPETFAYSILKDKPLWLCTPSDECVLPSGVQVWAAWLDLGGEERSEFWSALSSQETARAARFALERDRARFVAARGLLRVILGSCLGIEPKDVEFCCSAKGKPSLGGAFSRSGLVFNLARSDGLALFAVARRGIIGVDVERIRPVPDLAELAECSFSAGECAELDRLSGDDKTRGFFRIWTRKEACLKAVGEGITGSPKSVDVSGPPGKVKRFDGLAGGSPAVPLWVRDLAPAPGFLGALVSTPK